MRPAIAVFILFAFPVLADTAADLPVVDNPREAPRRVTVEYEEAWRAGTDDGEDFIFGVITKAVADDHGNVYLLDTQQQQVFKFSASGEYRGLVSRKGEGPGEINLVYNMAYPGGDRLALLKGFPAKAVMVDTTGLPLEGLQFELAPIEEKAPGFAMLTGCIWRGDHLLGSFRVAHSGGVTQDNSYVLARMGADGKEVHRYNLSSGGYDFTKPIHVNEKDDFGPFDSYTMDGEGRVYHTVEREAYLIRVLNPDASPAFVIRRDWEVHRRTDAEKERAKNGYSFGGNMELPPISYDMADTDEAISDIEVVGGELLVWSPRADRSENPDGPTYVSVFDLEGHLIEERHRNVPRVRGEDRILWLEDGRVVRVKAFRSALASSTTGMSRQVGENRISEDDLDDEALLEVIVYRPVSNQ